MPDLQPRSRLGWLRRIGGAVVILAVAGLLTLHAARQRRQLAESVHRFVGELCASAAAGRDLDPILAGTDPPIADPIAAAMRDRLPEGSWTLDVEGGDSGPGADGTATHTVTIAVDGRARLGLRLVHDDLDGSPRIIGYWLPDG